MNARFQAGQRPFAAFRLWKALWGCVLFWVLACGLGPAPASAEAIRSRLEETPLSDSQAVGLVYGVWAGEGAATLSVTLEPVWGLMLRRAVDGTGQALSPRRLPYGDVFTVQAEAGGRFRLLLEMTPAAGGVHQVKLGDAEVRYGGGGALRLSALSRLVNVADPNQPVSAAVLNMVREHNAAASQARDRGPERPAVAAAPALGVAAPGVSGSPTPLAPPPAVAVEGKDYELNPQAMSRLPPLGATENLLLLLKQKTGSEDYQQLSFDVVYDPRKLQAVLPRGSATHCRPHPTLVEVASDAIKTPGRLSVSLQAKAGGKRIYDQPHQLCTVAFTLLGKEATEISIENFTLNGKALEPARFATRPGGFGVTPKPVAPVAAAPPGQRLVATGDLLKADVVLGFNKQEIKLGVGGVEEVIVSAKKFPGGGPVEGVGLKMNFDPRAVKIVDRGGAEADKVLANASYELLFTNKVDNAQGTMEVNFATFDKEISAPVELFRFYVRGAALTPVGAIRINPNEVIVPGLAASNTVAVEPLNVLVTEGGTRQSVAGGQGFRLAGKKTVTFGTSSYTVAPESKKLVFDTGPGNINPDHNYDELNSGARVYQGALAGTEVLQVSGGAVLPRGRSAPRDGGGFIVEGGDWDITSVRGVSGSAQAGDENVLTYIPVIAWRDPASLRGQALVLTYQARGAAFTASNTFGSLGANIQQSTNLQIAGGVGGKVNVQGQVSENPGTQSQVNFKLTTRPLVADFGDVDFSMRGGAYTNLPVRQGEGVQLAFRPGGNLRDKLTVESVLMKAKSQQAPERVVQGRQNNPSGPFDFAPGEPVVPGSVTITIDGDVLPPGEYEVDYGRGQFRLIGRTLTQGQQARVIYEKSSFLFFTGGVTGLRVGYKHSPKLTVNYTSLKSQASQADTDAVLVQQDTGVKVCHPGQNPGPCTAEVGQNQFRVTQIRLDDRQPQEILVNFNNALVTAEKLAALTASGAITEEEYMVLSQPGANFTLEYGKDVFFKNPQEKYKGIWTLAPQSLLARMGGLGEVSVLYPYFSPTFVQELEILIDSYNNQTTLALPKDAYLGSEKLRVNDSFLLDLVGVENGLNEYTLETQPEPAIVLQNGTRLKVGDKLRVTYDVVPLTVGGGGTFDKTVQGVDFTFDPLKNLHITGEIAQSTGDLGSLTSPVVDLIEDFDTRCPYLKCQLSGKPLLTSPIAVEVVLPNGQALPITRFSPDYAANTLRLGRDESLTPYNNINLLAPDIERPVTAVRGERLDQDFCENYTNTANVFNAKCYLPFANLQNVGGFAVWQVRDDGSRVDLGVADHQLFANAGIVLLRREAGLPIFVDFDYLPTSLDLRVSYNVQSGATRVGEIARGKVATYALAYKHKRFDYTLNLTRKDKTFIEFASNTKGVGAADTNNESHTLNFSPLKGMAVAIRATEATTSPIGAAGSHTATRRVDVTYSNKALRSFRFSHDENKNEVLPASGGGGLGLGARNTALTNDTLGVQYYVKNKDRFTFAYDYSANQNAATALSGSASTSTQRNKHTLSANYRLSSRGKLGYSQTRAYEGNGWGYTFDYALLKNNRATFQNTYNNSLGSTALSTRFGLLPTRDLRFDITMDKNRSRSTQGLATSTDNLKVDIRKTRWGPFTAPTLTINRTDSPQAVQGGQRTEGMNLNTSFRLLKQVEVRPSYSQSGTFDATQDRKTRSASLDLTYTPRQKWLLKKGVSASYRVGRTASSTVPKNTATAAATTAAAVTSDKSGTFTLRFNPLRAMSTNFSYTFGSSTPTMRADFTYTHNDRLSFTGLWNSSHTAARLVAGGVGQLPTLTGATRAQTLTLSMKYRLTTLTALDVVMDRKSNSGPTPGSTYSGYTLKATLSAEFSGI